MTALPTAIAPLHLSSSSPITFLLFFGSRLWPQTPFQLPMLFSVTSDVHTHLGATSSALITETEPRHALISCSTGMVTSQFRRSPFPPSRDTGANLCFTRGLLHEYSAFPCELAREHSGRGTERGRRRVVRPVIIFRCPDVWPIFLCGADAWLINVLWGGDIHIFGGRIYSSFCNVQLRCSRSC